METELILKKLLGLIPDEEEQLKKFETEDILNNIDICDFTPNEIVMGDQLVDDQPVNTQTEVDDVQMYEQQQGHEEKKDGEDKNSEDPSVHTHIVPPSINDSEKNKEEEKIKEMIEDGPKEKKEEEEKEIEKSEPQMKTFEDATYVCVEKEYKKQRTKQLMKDIDQAKVALTVNKDHLMEALEIDSKENNIPVGTTNIVDTKS
ncbi:uncharacterized protein LOC131060025 [Cryptomeria japonica]|uniref:uncharacterized protein LOC131060025 n=1 Tax=Cryptomeria japonica TaxID=3369 RepID=UPI0027DA7AD8|nr:uncharacterized protein LOC131060025 [Cryptomeria japonica]